jgi:hypothetical protein
LFNYHQGKDLQQAEEDQVKYAPGKFDAATGNNFKTRRIYLKIPRCFEPF